MDDFADAKAYRFISRSGLNVNLKGLQVSMAQNVFDGDRSDSGLKQMHGFGVSSISHGK